MGRVLQGLDFAVTRLRSGAHQHAKTPRLRVWLLCLGIFAVFALSAMSQQNIALPAGMAYDTNGNLFIADSSLHQVVEVSVGGVLSIVAGSGAQGFGGDGAAATSALLNEPEGIAVGADGTLFIADTGNRRIRAVSHGVITTVAGSGARGNGGDGGPASVVTFDRPTALALTANAGLLICDTGNDRVRLLVNGTMQAFAGSGTQGFAGDGGPATSAQLDSPEGVAVSPDGRVVVADSHNQRLRTVGVDGLIRTVAGTGARGYAGDGGPATAAKLSLPRGVSVTASGAVIFADSNNQRIRMIDAGGNISTLAGNGVQGSSADAASANDAALNVPNGVAVSPYGATALGDLSAQTLRAVAANGKVYLVPAPFSRTSSVALTVPPSVIYGQTTASVMVTAAAGPQGKVELDEAGNAVGSGLLATGPLSIPLPGLSAGNHSLTASYAGDGVNPAATSAVIPFVIQPANVTARANAVSVAYGEALPPFSGAIAGILPQDASNVSVIYSTSATPLAGVGSYAIEATLTGKASGNYTLSNASTAGSLTVSQAKSTTAMQAVSQSSYAGLPLQLTATISPQFAGSPTGEVDFVENGAVVARAIARNGTASASYLSPSAGSHVVTASYVGDGNFLGSSSNAQSITVGAMPDFALASTASSQSVQAGLIASFLLNVTPQGGAFTGSVTFSVSGLPPGAQATFSPAAVVPGSLGASTTLNIQTAAIKAGLIPLGDYSPIEWLAFIPIVLRLRRRKVRYITVLGCTLFALTTLGCGARTVGDASVAASRSFPVQITATSTNLAGNVVTHTAVVTLTVQ